MSAKLPDKRTTDRIATMVESGLLRDDQFIPWADELVMSLQEPPGWVLELCTTPYRPKAAALLREYAAAPPFEPLDWQERGDDAVACFLLRYRRGELSWATFLSEAGQALDANDGTVPCEELFEMLNDLERAEYSKDVECKQRAEVERTFRNALARIEPLYATFMDYPRRVSPR